MEWQGRTTPLTVFTIAPPWWTVWLRSVWGSYHALRRIRRSRLMRRLERGGDVSPLAKLSSVSFAHWSLFNRVPTDDPSAPFQRLPFHYHLFQSNYSGAHDQYIESFALALPWLMKLLWAGAPGVPGPWPVVPFQRWISDNNHVPAHYYSAYPHGSTRMVKTALELQRRFDAFSPRAADLEPSAFAEHYDRFLGRVERSIAQPEPPGLPPEPGPGLTTLTRIRDGHQGQLLAELEGLPTGSESPFALIGGTHFGRWVIVPYLADRRGRRVSPASYLLFSAEFDGSVSEYLERLCTGGDGAPGRIWSHCTGYPGDVAEYLPEFLLEHRLEPGHSFAAFPDATVDRVRESLHLRAQLLDFAADHAGSDDAPALQRAWRERFPSAVG
ncbi:MAG: hypothetical protein QOK04_2790 [Solirubrobacteraceae bacterium]|jgi:hypothetical protein|nr:hypothetical protein [Solirubrobacteraceae bacterium]